MARIFDAQLRPAVIGWDTETFVTTRGNQTPRLICGTLWGFGEPPESVSATASAPGPLGAILNTYEPGDGLPATWEALFPRDSWLDAFCPLLCSSQTLVAHNSAYDQGVSVVLAEQIGHEEWAGAVVHKAVVDALAEGRLADTQWRDKLLAIAHGLVYGNGQHAEGGGWNLAEVVKRRFGRDIADDKKSPKCVVCNGSGKVGVQGAECGTCSGAGKIIPWRLRYHELDGVPVSRWPAKPVRYAIEDSKWAALVAVDQGGIPGATNDTDEGPLVDELGGVLDEDRQQRAAWSLHLAAVWGMRTDPERVELWRGEMEAEAAAGRAIGERLGFVRVKGRDKGKAGSVIMAKLHGQVEEAYAALLSCVSCGRAKPTKVAACPCGSEVFAGRTAPRTNPSKTFPEGLVKTDSDTLKESGDEDLINYEASKTAQRAVSTHLPILGLGTQHAMTSYPGVLVRSGRTSWSDPPLQQPPRKGRFRECFVPRPGFAYVSADWSSAETIALAQILIWLFGESRMAEALLDGQDLHVSMAADIMGIPYADAWAAYKDKNHPLHAEVKKKRQASKALNFGFPGGLGAKTMVVYARDSYGVRMTEAEAWEYKDAWLTKWPEMREYFAYFTRAAGTTGEFTYPQWVTLRQRGGCGFTDGCNTGFQGLVADAFKDVLWINTVGCYMRTGGVGQLHVPEHDGMSQRIDVNAHWEWTGAESPLFGSRAVLGVHDEVINEVPLARLDGSARELARIMVAILRAYCPDLAGAVRCEPAAMMRWYKDAELVEDADGLIIPWSPDLEEAA